MESVKILAIKSSCDVPLCGVTFNLLGRGYLHMRAEWKRAKSLGWTSLRIKGTSRLLTFEDLGGNQVRFSAKGWLAFCPKHRCLLPPSE